MKSIIVIAIILSTIIAPSVSAAPMGDEYPPERTPFTNKPVTPGDPESYIGTYGQCPFYENAMEKGCFPPSDIECNADWSYCQPRTASVSQPATPNATNTQPAPQNVATTPKSTNSGYSGAGSSSSYATNDANESTNVNETPKNVDVANDDVNKIDGIPVTDTERIKYDPPRDYSVQILVGGLAVVMIGFGIWYWYTQHWHKK